jgi:hypothetical protein
MRRFSILGATLLALGCSSAADAGSESDGAASFAETGVFDTGSTPEDSASPETSADASPDETTADTAPKEGLFVAVGYGGRRVSSKDGITWTGDVEDVPKGGDDEWLLRDVGYGGGSFVSVGWHVKTAPFSASAIAWTDAGKMGQWLGGIAYGKGKWVAAGGWGRRAYSTDGKTWKDGGDGGLHGAFRGLAFGGATSGEGRWVAVGDGGRRSTSLDGVAWEEGTGDSASGLGEVAYGGGTFVAIGGKTVLRSSDGKTWKSSTVAVDLDSVAWDGARFVAIGSGKALASTDGASWSELGSGPSGALAWGNGAFVATAWGGAVFRSTDGKSWTKVTTLPGDNSIARVRFFTP